MAPDPPGAMAEAGLTPGNPDQLIQVPAAAPAPAPDGHSPQRLAAVFPPAAPAGARPAPATPPVVEPPAATPAPAAAPTPSPDDPAAARSGRQVRRGRRVKRVVRRIELWSVLKLALVFYTCLYIVVMAALVLLWSFAYSTGLVDNFESFAHDVGFEHWQFYGQHMFHEAAVIGAVLVVAATVVTVLATALVNVISELTGGIRIVVIEEEVAFVPDEDDGTPATPAARRPPSSRRTRRS